MGEAGQGHSDRDRHYIVSKETYYSVKRDLLQNLGPALNETETDTTALSKETYNSVKRELLQNLEPALNEGENRA